jgi:hypothetical protein
MLLQTITEDKITNFIDAINVMSTMMNRKPKPYDVAIKFTSTLPLPFINNMIEIRKSQIHGNGVFTRCNIDKGTILTFYPAHAYRLIGTSENKIHCVGRETFDVTDDYKFNTREIEIFGNPKKINDTLLLGHMINDSSTICLNKSITSGIEIKNSVARYLLNSNNNCSAKAYKNIVYIVADKDIPINTELCMSYTFGYWISKQQLDIITQLAHSDANIQKFLKRFMLKN